MMKNFFSQRVVNLWNYLPQKAVEAKSIDISKAEIDRFLISKKKSFNSEAMTSNPRFSH